MKNSELYLQRTERNCVYNIQPIQNIPSVMDYGLLSHKRAEFIRNHISLANEDVQDLRAVKILPNGRRLHEYVNLFIDYWNPMLYTLCKNKTVGELCILEISLAVMENNGVYISSGNAAAHRTEFYNLPDGISKLDFESIFRRSWVEGFPEHGISYEELKIIKNAELLVPDVIPPDHISRVIVYDASAKNRLINDGIAEDSIEINPKYFF